MVHRVRLFAMLRERAGSDVVEVEVADGATVADALRDIAEQHSSLAEPINGHSVMMAVNREYARPETTLRPGDEIALIPPVSGGSR
jgi:molybdopterin converting factor subunit 1